MCLSEIWTDEEMAEWLEGQGEVIEVWKAVSSRSKKYHPIYHGEAQCFENGRNIALNDKISADSGIKYWSGYHFFLDKEEAQDYEWRAFEGWGEHIKCFIKKDWITAIGKAAFYSTHMDRGLVPPIVIVASQAIFPHYPEIEARYEDIEPFLEKKQEIAQPQMAV